jgi:hypothetical protein
MPPALVNEFSGLKKWNELLILGHSCGGAPAANEDPQQQPRPGTMSTFQKTPTEDARTNTFKERTVDAQ